MNSNNVLNLEEYLFSLEKKRDVELPHQLLEIDQEIEKLRQRRESVVKTMKDVALEIDHLKDGPRSTSLIDIPSPAWRLIQKCCIPEQSFGILNVCLASPTFDQIIKGNSVGITGEKVFRLLVENYYLDGNDIRSCLNSNSSQLQRFVGSAWVYLHPLNRKIQHQEFRSTRKITDFAKIANQSKQKWQLFAFKWFTFDAELCKTEENYDEFWNAAFIFIKSFGFFLLRVTLLDEFVAHDGMKNICKDLLQLLPRIEYFNASVYFENQDADDLHSYFIFMSNRRHDHGGNHSLCVVHTISISSPFLELVGPQSRTWDLEAHNLPQVSPEQLSPTICRDVSVFKFNGIRGFDQLMEADLSNFVNVVTLVLDTNSQSINLFHLLQQFPRVKTIELSGGCGLTPLPPPQTARFPTVTKLILHLKSGNLPPALDTIPQLLPSLIQLTIKSSGYSKTDFAAQLLKANTEDTEFQRQNVIIDVYRVYGEGRSIMDSNIWQHMQKLSRIIVETAEYMGENAWELPNICVRTEIFARSSY